MWSVSYTKSKYTWIFLFSNPHPKCKDFRNRGAQIPRIPHGMCFKSGAQNYQTSIMSIFTSWPPLLVIHLSRISSASWSPFVALDINIKSLIWIKTCFKKNLFTCREAGQEECFYHFPCSPLLTTWSNEIPPDLINFCHIQTTVTSFLPIQHCNFSRLNNIADFAYQYNYI